MPVRIKYPLTPEAKEAAIKLLDTWEHGHGEQYMLITPRQGKLDLARLSQSGALEDFGYPRAGPLLELAKFGLIDVRTNSDSLGHVASIEILLLQELRNAVENDFEVSDYFLTLNAVGTIVYGNLEVQEGAIFQSAAAGQGDIIQNTGQLADRLEELLGDEVLAQHEQLKTAIQELRSVDSKTDERTRLQKMGGVIEELGRSLDHIGKAGAAIHAIMVIAQFFSG